MSRVGYVLMGFGVVIDGLDEGVDLEATLKVGKGFKVSEVAGDTEDGFVYGIFLKKTFMKFDEGVSYFDPIQGLDLREASDLLLAEVDRHGLVCEDGPKWIIGTYTY